MCKELFFFGVPLQPQTECLLCDVYMNLCYFVIAYILEVAAVAVTELELQDPDGGNDADEKQ